VKEVLPKLSQKWQYIAVYNTHTDAVSDNVSDVNKDLTFKAKDQDKDQTYKNKDQDLDQTPKDKDQTFKAKDQDKD